ncbi:hypothetical protein KHQ82_01885 [Mycoplasmatota bacterium]|nr:hypothetical protein KHQ82_01885 [Mycoplasmatota bacterium]
MENLESLIVLKNKYGVIMYLASELSHINSRFTSYVDDFYKTSLRETHTMMKDNERINTIFLYTLLIHFYSSKLMDIERKYPKWHLYSKIIVVIVWHAFKKCIRKISVSFIISLFLVLIFKLTNLHLLYTFITIYVFLLSVLFMITQTIIRQGRLVINSQKALDTENEINVFVGEESLEVMLSNDIAIGIINKYSSDVVYKLAYDDSSDAFEFVLQADQEILDFAAKMHLKKLIDNKGRSFQIAGLISALNIAYSKIVTSIKSNKYDHLSLRNFSLHSLKVYNYSVEDKIVNDLNEFIDNLLKEGSFDIDYIETIDIIECLIIILLCKDRLMELKERYSNFDNL